MTDQTTYFDYLKRRSALGALYRRHVLYPRISRRLHGKVLDVGCGIGDMLAFYKDSVGVDVNEHTVRFCRERGLDARVMPLDSLPLATASFRSALMDNVLEHIPDPRRLLAEVRRVLQPRGRLVVGVPGVRGWHADVDHKVAYDERQLVQTLQDNGFALQELFFTPLMRSNWLSHRLRQYCIYGAFDAV